MSKHKLIIHYSSEVHACDTCGMRFAEGAVATLDGRVIIDEPASASCFHCTYVNSDKVLRLALESLGVEIEEHF